MADTQRLWRDAQALLDWIGERRARPPWATQDVPDAEQIVRFR